MNFPRKSALLALFVLFILSLALPVASTKAGGDEPWRPITPGDLAIKEPQVEKDADAEAIFWEVRIDDSSSDDLALNHYVRVKIFTERGREKYSKIDVQFVKGKKVKNLAARVIKPDGSIIELKKEEIFEREIVRVSGLKVKAKSFAVPSIEPGVIVEYRYREVFDNAGADGMRLDFQRDIPVQRLSYYYKPNNKKSTPKFQAFNAKDIDFVEDQNGFYLATKSNVPSFKEEPQMPPADQVRPWLLLQSGRNFELTSFSEYGFTFVIKDPSNPTLYWGAVGNQNSFYAKFMNKSDKEVKRNAAEITASASTSEDKLRKLYEFCQTQIKNTTTDTTLTDEQRKKLPVNKSIGDTLKRKSGTSLDVDLLFGAMAGTLGLDTRAALMADRSEMFFEPNMTNESFIRPGAIAVKIDNNWKIFRPSVASLAYGELPWYQEDVYALLVGESKSSWFKTPLAAPEKSVSKRTGKFKLSEDGTLEGDVRIEYSGHSGLSRKLDNDDASPAQREENLKEEIKRRISSAEISNIQIENVIAQNKPLVYAFKVKVPGYATRTGKRLFLQPGFFEYGANPAFSGATRKYDIYFNYPWSEEDNIEIALPAGFTLDNADAPGAIADPEKVGVDKVTMAISADKKMLTYNRSFKFGGGGNILFPNALYAPLKTLFDAFHKADTHTVSLKQQN